MTFFLRLLPCRPTDACQGYRRYRRLFFPSLASSSTPPRAKLRPCRLYSSPPSDVAPPKCPDDFPIGTMRRDAGTSGHRDNTIVLSRLSRLSRHRNPAENRAFGCFFWFMRAPGRKLLVPASELVWFCWRTRCPKPWKPQESPHFF